MGHLASATLAGILQMVVRTGLMGIVSVILSRYSVLTFLAIGLLFFLSTRIYSALKQTLGPKMKMNFTTLKEVYPPLVIALGVFCMYRGRRFLDPSAVVAGGSVDGGVVDNAIAGMVAVAVVEVPTRQQMGEGTNYRTCRGVGRFGSVKR
eukprot:g12745.t1 g12745   contig7:30220-31221(+)